LYSLETLTIDHGAAVHVSQLPDKTALWDLRISAIGHEQL
jgi:hypothetical protein